MDSVGILSGHCSLSHHTVPRSAWLSSGGSHTLPGGATGPGDWGPLLWSSGATGRALNLRTTGKCKANPSVKAVSPQVTISHAPTGRLPLLSARPVVIFPATEQHRPLAGTKLYCLVTEARKCEQLAQGCYTAFAPSRIWTHDLLFSSSMLYPLHHCSTLPCYTTIYNN